MLAGAVDDPKVGERGLRRLLVGFFAASTGDGLFFTILPLVAVSLTVSPAEVAAVSAIGSLPWLMMSLPAGALADRMDRRTLALTASVLRALAVTGLAVALLTGQLGYGLLLAFVFVIGVGEVCFDTTSEALIPSVVGSPEQLAWANARLSTIELLMNQFIGKPLGPLIVVATSLGVGLTVGGGMYLLAGLAMLLLRPAPPPAGPRAGLIAEIRQGVSVVWGHPALRAIALLTAGINFCVVGLASVFVLFVTREIGAPEWVFGLLQAMLAVGALVGAPLMPWISRRLGDLGAVQLAAALIAASMFLTPVGKHVLVVGAGSFLCGVGTLFWRAGMRAYQQKAVPDELLGRSVGFSRMLSMGAISAGAAGGGAVSSTVGVTGSYFVFGSLAALVALFALLWLVDPSDRAGTEAGYPGPPISDGRGGRAGS